jgi:Fe-S-cluster containining protein
MPANEFIQITRRDRFSEEEFYPMVNRMFEYVWENLMPPQILTDGLSNTVKNNIITPPETPIPDCLTCGACCQSLLCVGVRPSDSLSPEHYWDITSKTEEGDEIVVDRYLRRDDETLACVALVGTIGEKVGCSIYETRPKMCHHFDAGSDRCHAIRRAYFLEPFLSIEEMTEAIKKLDSKTDERDLSEVIRNARIESEPGDDLHRIDVLMMDNTLRRIHTFDPELETWMQFEFDGLKMSEATELIDLRRQNSMGKTGLSGRAIDPSNIGSETGSKVI